MIRNGIIKNGKIYRLTREGSTDGCEKCAFCDYGCNVFYECPAQALAADSDPRLHFVEMKKL